jgi:hypothetical protein
MRGASRTGCECASVAGVNLEKTVAQGKKGIGGMMGIEDQYLDVLQNIEFAIVSTYRRHPRMTDYEVMRVLEAVIDSYKAEALGRAPRETSLSEMETETYAAVRDICEWRLGRAAAPGGNDLHNMSEPQPIKVDEIILCLKKILNSVKKWNKSGGRTGYLDFIVQYVR